ncbi:MAG TPA: hypothetical protein DEH78_02080 [Solibacterales bacterium]|nr:hypothetical protein [Bryobacterales bacterium]
MTKLAAGLCLAHALLAGTAISEGVDINYESYGKGRQALIFVHGWTCDLTFWRGQAPVYEKRRSLLIDLPGHGKSGKPEVAYTQERFARAIDSVMVKEGVEQGVLIGHSMGGPVSLTFLRLFPKKVKGVVLVDSNLPPSPEDTEKRQQWAAIRKQFGAMWRSPEWKQHAAKFLASMYSPKTSEAARAEIEAKMLIAPMFVRASAFEEMFAMDGPRAGESYPVAAASIAAAGPHQEGEARLRKLFPKLSKYEAWEGYGHFLMMEDAQRFNRSLEEFLSSVK